MTTRILVVQLADIGDLILSTPALAALREAHPTAHIAVLTTAHAAAILQNSGLADDVIPFDKHTFDSPKALLKPQNALRALKLAAQLRRGHYDTTLLFHHFSTRLGTLKFAALAWSAGSERVIGLDNGNGFFLTERIPDEGFGARHQATYWLALAARTGASSAPRPAIIGTTAADHSWAENILRQAGDQPCIAIHAGSGGYSLARRWDAASFAAVADALSQQHNARIFFVGGKGDDTASVLTHMQQPALDLSGQTTLAQLYAFLSRCTLFIGADSGVMHLAAAAGVPLVALFGPSNHHAWQPWAQRQSIVLRSAPLCSPCSYIGSGVGLRNGCPARTCMRMVTPQHVINAAARLLQQTEHDSPLAYPQGQQSQPASARAQRLRLLNIPVDAVTYDDWLKQIQAWINSKDERCRQVCTVNPEMLMIARKDSLFRSILQRADLCVPDGVGLLWAARHVGRPLPARVTGSDGVPRIAEAAAHHGWRIFLLGAAPGVAEQAANALRERYAGLQIVGTESGSPSPEDEDALVEQINASGADILFVAYGAPEQEKWIARNLPRLRSRMAMGIGGTLDFIAGVVPRAPAVMQRMGLEWLFRLWIQPWRFWRMLRLPRFVLAILLEKRDN
jgi:heptosyltransferase-2